MNYVNINKKCDYQFISLIVQRGRQKPVKYTHYLKMKYEFYQEMRDIGVIMPEDYFIDETAFFEFKNAEVIISFISLYQCEDLQRKIDHHLIIKYHGNYPIIRGFSV